MIIVKIQGGLGNQMFQYAFGRRMALQHGVELALDISLYDTYPHHPYGLSSFAIKERFATSEEIALFTRLKPKPGRRWAMYNILFADRSKYKKEQMFNYDPQMIESKSDAYFDGYRQTERYIQEIEDIIREEFTLTHPLSSESLTLHSDIGKTTAVSLHVRRGLYVSHPLFSAVHGSCGPAYYKKAVAHIAASVKNPHFFVFSDDPTWARENIKQDFPTTYVSHISPDAPHEDIILMSACKHHILANSTFSWWGAWLNPSKEKVVVGPKKRFEVDTFNTVDILPPSWVRL